MERQTNKQKSLLREFGFTERKSQLLAAWSGWREDVHLLNKVLIGLLVHGKEEPLSVGKSLY